MTSMTEVSHGAIGLVESLESGPRIEARRERQRQEARRTILDATEALMIEANGPDFSIRKLGDRSGYSAPTVYHYFGDKDGLIDALLEDRLARLAEELEQVEPDGDPRAGLRAMLLAYFDFCMTNPTFTRLMWTLSRKGESRMPPAMTSRPALRRGEPRPFRGEPTARPFRHGERRPGPLGSRLRTRLVSTDAARNRLGTDASQSERWMPCSSAWPSWRKIRDDPSTRSTPVWMAGVAPPGIGMQ